MAPNPLLHLSRLRGRLDLYSSRKRLQSSKEGDAGPATLRESYFHYFCKLLGGSEDSMHVRVCVCVLMSVLIFKA